MDESGHSASPTLHFAGMAGFVAPSDAWQKVGATWQDVLDIFHVKTFHAKEFAHSAGEFKEWKGKETKRRLFYYGLVSTLAESGAVPVGGIVSLEDFRSLTEAQQSNFKDPYYIAFQNCTRGAAVQAAFLDPPEKVAMVYAYNQEFGALPPQETYSVDQAGDAEKLWHTIKSVTDFGNWMGGYGSSTPKDTVQLQAADLFAYELAKEFESQIVRPNDSMRWGMKQLLKLVKFPNSFIRLYDRKELLRTIIESDFPDKTGTEEVGDVDTQMFAMRHRMSSLLRKRAGL